jgi:hypothetical protein
MDVRSAVPADVVVEAKYEFVKFKIISNLYKSSIVPVVVVVPFVALAVEAGAACPEPVKKINKKFTF